MRRLLALTAKISISATLLYLAFARVDISTIGSRLQQVKIAWLVALVLALALQIVLVALRWQRIALLCGAPISITTALRYMLIGSFFNQTLPSTIGGDAARIWFVARAGAGWQAAAYSVIVDRIVGLAVLVAIVIICLPWLLELVRDPLGRVSLLAVNGAGIAATIVFLIMGQARWRWLDRWWITRHIAGTAAITLKIFSNRHSASTVVALSIAVHLLTIAAVWYAARALAAPLEFGQALLLVPPVVLVATIPISIAGWGVREGAMMAAFAYAGLLDADGLIVSVLYGAGLFMIGIAGGAIWILASEHRTWATDQNPRES
jgi:glycosyltransferase 2 family protein